MVVIDRHALSCRIRQILIKFECSNSHLTYVIRPVSAAGGALDVKAYFDSIDWELMLKAVRHYTDCPWVLLYIERWLTLPCTDGRWQHRAARGRNAERRGEHPLLANLFLHYAFDAWMKRTYPFIPFERYADDIVCRCKSAAEARSLWSAIASRFATCKLVLHPEKTKIVYCKDENRRGEYPNCSFDFSRVHLPGEKGDVGRAFRAQLHTGLPVKAR